MMDNVLARFVLMTYVDMFQLLKRLKLHPREFGNMMCPFHHNTNTPAAKMYHDKYGWCLYCFNEKRIFTTYDVYKQILGLDPIKAATIIWEKLSPEEQTKVKELCGNQEEFEGDIPFMNELDMFSQNKISYKRLCDLIALKL